MANMGHDSVPDDRPSSEGKGRKGKVKLAITGVFSRFQGQDKHRDGRIPRSCLLPISPCDRHAVSRGEGRSFLLER